MGLSGGSQSFVLVSEQASRFVGHVAEDVEEGGELWIKHTFDWKLGRGVNTVADKMEIQKGCMNQRARLDFIRWNLTWVPGNNCTSTTWGRRISGDRTAMWECTIPSAASTAITHGWWSFSWDPAWNQTLCSGCVREGQRASHPYKEQLMEGEG